MQEEVILNKNSVHVCKKLEVIKDTGCKKDNFGRLKEFNICDFWFKDGTVVLMPDLREFTVLW